MFNFTETLLGFLVCPIFYSWLLMFYPIFKSKILSKTTTFTEKLNTVAISRINYGKKRIRERMFEPYTYSQSTYNQNLEALAPMH